MNKTKIQWTQYTWNPFTGCTPYSVGCINCYAKRLALTRLRHLPEYKDGFKFQVHYDRMKQPYKWKKPKFIFVNSMSDTFHIEASEDAIFYLMKVIHDNQQHIFQVLTKRAGRMEDIMNIVMPFKPSVPNLWLGVSIEDKYVLYERIYELRKVKNISKKFISFEPLLGPIGKMDFSGIDWVIVGGETGRNARPIQVKWIRDIRDSCIEQNIPFFFKQWGGKIPKAEQRLLDGREWNQIPENHIIKID